MAWCSSPDTMATALRCFVLCCCCWSLASAAPTCRNRMDLVVVLDAASSPTAALFAEAKSAVKGIAAGLTIGPAHTRLALVRVARGRAQLVSGFDRIAALTDFNAAVDQLAIDAAGVGDIADGLKLARDGALSAARTNRISTVVLLVKDRRSVDQDVTHNDRNLLGRVASEAAAVRAMGAAVHAVGVGGLWNREVLEAIFGSDYALFKTSAKAFESAKSLLNLICEANCPDKGRLLRLPGLCNAGSQPVVSANVTLVEDAATSICRREIQSGFDQCTDTRRCNKLDRVVGPCNSKGLAAIESIWQIFDYKLQSCVTTSSTQIVNCADSLNCVGQAADVIFLLDRSTSMGTNFPFVKRTTVAIISALSIGPDQVRVGVITFERDSFVQSRLASTKDKNYILSVVNAIPDEVYEGSPTYTNLALRDARMEFRKDGRPNVAKFVFLITDGVSTNPEGTFEETALIKNDSVTLYAIGIGAVSRSELQTMTEPESDTRLVIFKDFSLLDSWSANFSKRICIELAAPNPKMCDNRVFMQSISECTKGIQQVTRTEYHYDATMRCIKSVRTTLTKDCRIKCIDPIDGNEYQEGEKWTTRCQEFECAVHLARPLRPVTEYCVAAGGQCMYVGSQPFDCLDEKGRAVKNCKCIRRNGRPVLLIETN